MAEITDKHCILAHQVYMMGELHGRDELKRSIAQAIADAEERGQQELEKNDDAHV
jgi:hypothetical protein